jgi:hypothetical protein
LSARPEAYGQLKPCHDVEARRQRVSLLLHAARAYSKADGKARAHAVDQLELKLPIKERLPRT